MAEKADELKTRDEKIAQAKELYSRGSRNYLVKLYNEAADDLSQVCSLYEELYGPLCDELGMPYLLYAKSLLALAFEENKVIDVPEEDDEDEEVDETAAVTEEDNKESTDSGLSTIAENGEEEKSETKEEDNSKTEENKESSVSGQKRKVVESKESVSATGEKSDEVIKESKSSESDSNKEKIAENVEDKNNKEDKESENSTKSEVQKDSKPGTSNGQTVAEEDTNEDAEDDNEQATNLQVAWETLELAAKIFEKQGEPALPNLAEVKTELGNIQFENNVLDAAREDYNNALKIYKQLPSNYRRAMAEIHYKIGLTYLMQEQQSSKESVESLKQACELLDEEIKEMKTKPDLTEQNKTNIDDMEETRQEIWVKITEIEESHQQCLAEVRAALDSYISPSKDPEIAGPSSSTSTDKPVTDISHLIKRKKPDSSNDSEASPAKRPTL